ncbi:hypothetical protein L9F63_005268, partial [Diploptera punctata]
LNTLAAMQIIDTQMRNENIIIQKIQSAFVRIVFSPGTPKLRLSITFHPASTALFAVHKISSGFHK